MSFQRKCPAGTNKIMTMVESGLGTDEIAAALQEISELKVLESLEGEKTEMFPGEIRIIAQALAFRTVDNEADFDSLFDVLSIAYSAEVIGEESFRLGEAISRETLINLYADKSYQWLIVECPNGQGVEADGAILGVSCFSTGGVSRKNGEVEGRLGVIRLFGVLPRYHGLCIGNRLLKRVEGLMGGQGCVRCMVCIPSPRSAMMTWIDRRGYSRVGACPYPTSIGHKLCREGVELVNYVKPIILDAKSNKIDDNKGVSSQNSSSQIDSQNNGNNSKIRDNINSDKGMKNKQNMSLPPHWRLQQPTVEDIDENYASKRDEKDKKNEISEDFNNRNNDDDDTTQTSQKVSLNSTSKDLLGIKAHSVPNVGAMRLRPVLSISDALEAHYTQPDMD